MPDHPLVTLALAIATARHAGVYRRGGLPYITHPVAVAAALETPEDKALALLHDVPEDTGMTEAELIALGIPADIAADAVAMAKLPGETYETYLARVKLTARRVRVKLADIRHNLPTALPKARARYLAGIAYLSAPSE